MSEPYVAKGRPTYAMRLATTERKRLEAAAALRGEALSQYIRRTALAAAWRDLAQEAEGE